jgi:hypothetical protein
VNRIPLVDSPRKQLSVLKSVSFRKSPVGYVSDDICGHVLGCCYGSISSVICISYSINVAISGLDSTFIKVLRR